MTLFTTSLFGSPLSSRALHDSHPSWLAAPLDCVTGFSAAKWDLLNLVTSQTCDQSATGLSETVHTIRKESLEAVGAGRDIDEGPITRQWGPPYRTVTPPPEIVGHEHALPEDGTERLPICCLPEARGRRGLGTALAVLHFGREGFLEFRGTLA